MILDSQQEKDSEIKQQTKKKSAPKKEEDQLIGPNPKKLRKIQYHDILLEGLPSSDLYEISYMHRDLVNNVISSAKTDFIITFSVDGHIKFWKKVFNLIQFNKNFKAHNGLITGASLSKNHDLLCSVGLDKTLKIFDTLNCDLRTVIKLNFTPNVCQFIPQQGKDWELIAINEQKTGKIWIIDPQGKADKSKIDDDQQVIQQKITNQDELIENQNKRQENVNVLEILSFHKHPIKFIKMNWAYNFCFSIDERGFLELWDPNTFDFPTNLKYKFKLETDFLQLIQANSAPLSLSISPKGKYLAVMLKDKMIRIFKIQTGKLVISISQNIKDIMKIQEDINHPNHAQYVLDQHEFQKKLNLQKDLQVSKQYQYNPNIEFDEAQQFLIYASFYGIKFYSLSNKCVQRIIGRKQTERFIRVSVFQGRMMRNPSGNANAQGERKAFDPNIVCTSFKRPRFYIFSKRTPDLESENAVIRDVINERQNKQQTQLVNQLKMTQKQNEVVLQTTMGDIHLLLYLEDCPKTCQNFIKLVKKGYYNGMIFHRVIKGFMNQSGCPKGDGTGGQSIWGGNFQDELRPQKHRFDRPYVLAMANRGPNTNGSQFFITVVACPWLDNKHTIFGRVIKGIESVCQINKLKTDKGEKPLINVKIMSAKVI